MTLLLLYYYNDDDDVNPSQVGAPSALTSVPHLPQQPSFCQGTAQIMARETPYIINNNNIIIIIIIIIIIAVIYIQMHFAEMKQCQVTNQISK